MREPVIPVTREIYRDTVARILTEVDAQWRILPIGGSAMAQGSFQDAAALTKDIDLVLLLLGPSGPRIASLAVVEALARRVGEDVRSRKDQTSVELRMRVAAGSVRVEFVRGRNPQSGGYFVTRPVLEAVASHSKASGRMLEPPPEGLAILKAWAATDQDKLVASGKDLRGFHTGRSASFRKDVRAILASILDRGQAPDLALLDALVAACPPGRGPRVRAILEEAGWFGAGAR